FSYRYLLQAAQQGQQQNPEMPRVAVEVCDLAGVLGAQRVEGDREGRPRREAARPAVGKRFLSAPPGSEGARRSEFYLTVGYYDAGRLLSAKVPKKKDPAIFVRLFRGGRYGRGQSRQSD